MRRLLILPALALVLLGTPVLALDQHPPPATTQHVPVAPAAQTERAGFRSASTPVHANLVGVEWQGDPAATFTVDVLDSRGTWTSTSTLASDAEADPATKDVLHAAATRGGLHATEPVWLGNDVDAVQVHVVSGQAAGLQVAAVSAPVAGAPSGSAGALGGWVPPVSGSDRDLFAGALFGSAALLGAVALGWSPWRRRRHRRVRMVAVLAVAAVGIASCASSPPIPGGSQPAITSRSAWGARAFDCAGGPQYAPSLQFAVVHHTVNSNTYSPTDSPAIVRAIQAYHMDTNGFCDIAYNFLVDQYGQIFEGRDGGITQPVIGAHAGGFNSGSVGVALIGDFTTAPVPSAMFSSLVSLLAWRLPVGGVDPQQSFSHTVSSSPCNCMRWPVGTTVTFPNSIVGHRDVDYTECPGDQMWNRLGELRADVEALIPHTAAASTASR
jgi:hypothetical protein